VRIHAVHRDDEQEADQARYPLCPDGVPAAPAVGFDEQRAGLLATTGNSNTITEPDPLLR